MSGSTPQPYDDLSTSKLLMAAILGVVITIASVAWLEAMYYVQATAEEKAQLSETPVQVRETKAKWTHELNAWGAENVEKKTAKVPIDRAIEAFVQEQKQPR